MGEKTEKAPTSSQAGEFRRQAEKRLRIKKTASGGVTSETDVRALLHELQAHQIELEMLNEELQRTWAAAEESSQNYCDLFDFAPVGYFLWDRQGLIAEVNLTGAALLGLDRNEVIRKRFGQFVAMSDRLRFAEFCEQVLATNTKHACEVKILKNGQAVSLHVEAIAASDRQGQERLCRVAVLDISPQKKRADELAIVNHSLEAEIAARKQAEEHLQLSRQRMALHVQQTPLAVVEFDVDGRVREWNPAAVAVFGFSREEAIGQHWTFIVPEAARDAVEGVWENLLAQSGGSRSTNENRTKNGKTISCEWFSTPLVDASGKMVGAASLVMDVTQRKRAEDALRASEAKYRQLHDTMRDAFGSTTMDGRFQECNKAFLEMLGYTWEELRTLTYTDVTPAKWHALDAGIVAEQVVPRGYSDVYEKEYRKKDGAVFPVELRVLLLTDDSGQPCGTWAIVRDITERKRVEKELRRASRRPKPPTAPRASSSPT